MLIFRNRPFALACVVAAIVAVFAADRPKDVTLTLLFVGAALVILPLCIALFTRKCGAVCSRVILTAFCCSLILLSSFLFFHVRVPSVTKTDGETVTVEATVTEVRGEGATWGRYVILADEWNGEHTSRRLLLEWNEAAGFGAGTRIRFRGTVCAFRTTDTYDEAASLLSDGILGVISCEDPSATAVLKMRDDSFPIRLKRWNASLSTRLAEGIDGEAGALAAAILLGNRSFLSGETVLSFRRAGVSHLLALSGLHIGILIAALEWFLRKIRIPKTVRAVLIILVSFAYLAVSGGALSTLRAVLMTALLYISFLRRESYDPFTAVAASLFAILVFLPFSVLDVGFWLSFCAAGAIVVFVPAIRPLFKERISGAHGIRRWLLRAIKTVVAALAVGLFAFCATLPLSAKVYGEASLTAVPATVLLSPLFSCAVISCWLAFLIPLLPLRWITARLLSAMIGLTRSVSEQPTILVNLQSPLPTVLLWLSVISISILAVIRLRRKIWLAVPIILSVAVLLAGRFVLPSGANGICTTYLHGKNRESVLFTDCGKAVLVDVSGGNVSSGYEITDALRRERCTELCELVLTHYHEAYVGWIDRLASLVKIRTLCLPSPEGDAEKSAAALLAEEATKHGISVRTNTDTLSIPELSLKVWRADPEAEREERAVVWIAEQNGFRLSYVTPSSFSGTLSVAAREAFATADVLIVGSHASGLSGKLPEPLPDVHWKRILLSDTGRVGTLRSLPQGVPVIRDATFDKFFMK